MKLNIDQGLSAEYDRATMAGILRDIQQSVNALAEGRQSGSYAATTSVPTTGSYAIGDFVKNSNPVEVSGQYVVYGWECVASGTPGTWVECRFLTNVSGSTIGKHSIPIMAGSMRPSVSGGCAALAGVASGANLPDIVTLDFDTTTVEYAQFSIPMPKSWNEGTVTFRPVWSHAATATNFGVVWGLQGISVSDNEAIGTAFGTQQNSADTGGTTDRLYIGPESSAITIAGTPAAEDVVFFRVQRVTGDGSDTMAIDARLHAIIIYITTAADTDA